MFKTMVLAVLLINSALLARDDDDDYSTAIHEGEGKAYHDGDYVNFSLEFSASCFDNQIEAHNVIVNNVEHISSWLKSNTFSLSGETISYDIELINIWKNENMIPIAGEENWCFGKFNVSQKVNITLTRSTSQASITNEGIQAFYEAIQLAITPLSYSEGTSLVYSQVTDVTKGLFEESIDVLRRAAKVKAQKKAIADFLASFDGGFDGWWELSRIDFSNRSYSYELSSSYSPRKMVDAVPAKIKLKPLSISAEGLFTFRFESNKNHLGD